MPSIDQITNRMKDLSGGRVWTGPFEGMAYDTEAVHSAHLPKLIGCYERELHANLERFLAKSYTRIINIGCGEGYYAVGLALRFPDARIEAFDSEERARDLCRALAQTNGVSDRVKIHGACTVDGLRNVLRPGSLIICDCEGAEIDLLRPDLLPALNHCDLVVELHDNNGLNASAQVPPRFQFTHAMQVVPAEPRRAEEFQPLLDQAIKRYGSKHRVLVRGSGVHGPRLPPSRYRQVAINARQ